MLKPLTYSFFLAALIKPFGVAVAVEGTAVQSSEVAGPPSEAQADSAGNIPAEPSGGENTGASLFEQSLSGGEAAKGSSERSQLVAPFTLNGYTRGDAYVGEVPGTHRGDSKAAYGELSMALRPAKQPYGDGYAEVRLRYGFQGSRSEERRVG